MFNVFCDIKYTIDTDARTISQISEIGVIVLV
jgi:hypothetical protein